MTNLVLTRIDSRLVHGQVITSWIQWARANLIVVVNDQVAEDTLRQNLMSMAVPDGIGIRYFSVQKAIETLPKAGEWQKIALLVDNPTDLVKLVEGGIPLSQVIVGNMHMDQGKKQISKSICVNKQDVEAFYQLSKKDIQLLIWRVPTETSSDLITTLKGENL